MFIVTEYAALNETVLLKTKSTLFNLLIRETSQFLCYERLLNIQKIHFFRKMQFWSHCYTVVSYQALFRLSVHKIPAVYLSGARMCVFARYATLVPQLLTEKCYILALFVIENSAIFHVGISNKRAYASVDVQIAYLTISFFRELYQLGRWM